MPRLMPFFTYYGGKHRATRHYPSPAHGTIIEPFAGSAGYSVNFADRQVILRDLDPVIVGTWRYLIETPADELAALPDLEEGQSVDDLDVPQAARWLIGWWLAKGTSLPQRRPTSFMLRHPRGGPYWGERIRERIASQVEFIRHWRIELGSYVDLPNDEATWFIDPPYRDVQRTYTFGSRDIDYAHLADFCRSRRGQVIVCEADDADWLPFRPLVAIDGTEGRQKKKRARMEVIYP